MRLDIYLVQNGHFPSREKAKMAVQDGRVLVGGKVAVKAGLELKPDDEVSITAHDLLKYVSMGGLKLEKAISDFDLDFNGKQVLDIGASTGGFTDCALQHGAALVWAVDVGENQLHGSLRDHPRVRVYEQTNIKDFKPDTSVDLIVMDVSFTSQIPLFPYIAALMETDTAFVSLIKPQFELQQRRRFTNGIVTDATAHRQVLRQIQDAAAQTGLFLHKITVAPVRPDKNTEYLALFRAQPPLQPVDAAATVPPM